MEDTIEKNKRTELLIMNCPYCGSSDLYETQRTLGNIIEAAWISCMSCGEDCAISRSWDEKEVEL